MTSLTMIRADRLTLRAVPADAPWHWLAAGWRDLVRAPGVSLTYGALFAAASALLTAGLWMAGWIELLPALAGGFMLVGPMLAVGLYETSRRLERGEHPGLRQVLLVRTRSPAQLAFLGLALMLLLLFWIHAAFLLLALFLATTPPPTADAVVAELLLTAPGLAFLAVGTLVGAVFAAVTFALSVVAAPLLLDRQLDVVTAMLTSLRAVRRNWRALVLWAWLVALITIAGLATGYIGLIVTFPLIGHATWHAYRALVARE